MKIIWILILLACLFSFSANAGVDFNVYQENYSSYETVQVDFNFIDEMPANELDLSQVGVFRDGVKIPVSFALYGGGRNYACQFILDNFALDIYEFRVGDVYVKRNGKISKERYSINFSVGGAGGLRVWPAYYSVVLDEGYEGQFKFNLENFEPANINVILDVEGHGFDFSRKDIILSPGSQKDYIIKTKLFGLSGNYFSGFFLINYTSGSYRIPFFVEKKSKDIDIVKDNVSEDAVILGAVGEPKLLFVNKSGLPMDYAIRYSLVKSESVIPAKFRVLNNGTAPVSDLKYKFTGNLGEIIGVTSLLSNNLDAGQSTDIDLSLDASKLTKDFYSGSLVVYSGEIEAGIDFEFNVVKENATANNTAHFNFSEISVSSPVIDGEKKFNWGWIFVVAVLLIIGLIIFMLYNKMKPEREKYEKFIKSVAKEN